MIQIISRASPFSHIKRIYYNSSSRSARTYRCFSPASRPGYDQGDCCEASCVDGDFVCGENGFDCLDPDYKDGYPQQSSYSYEDWCEHELDGDGNCDSDNNSEECGKLFRLQTYPVLRT